MKKKIIDHKVLESPSSIPTNEIWENVINNVQLSKFSSCGKYLAVVRFNGVLEVWDVETVHLPMMFLDPLPHISIRSICVDICWYDTSKIGAIYVNKTESDENGASSSSSIDVHNSSHENGSSSSVHGEENLSLHSTDSVVLIWTIAEQQLTAGFKLPYHISTASFVSSNLFCFGNRTSGHCYSVDLNTNSINPLHQSTSNHTSIYINTQSSLPLEVLDVTNIIRDPSHSASSSGLKSRQKAPTNYFSFPYLQKLSFSNDTNFSDKNVNHASNEVLIVLEAIQSNKVPSTSTVSSSGNVFYESLYSIQSTNHSLSIYNKGTIHVNQLDLIAIFQLPTIGQNISHFNVSLDNRMLCLATVDGWVYIINIHLAVQLCTINQQQQQQQHLSKTTQNGHIILQRIPPACLSAYYCYPANDVKPVTVEQPDTTSHNTNHNTNTTTTTAVDLVSINLPALSQSVSRIFNQVQLIPAAQLPDYVLSSNSNFDIHNQYFLLLGTTSFNSTGSKPSGLHALSNKLLFLKLPSTATSDTSSNNQSSTSSQSSLLNSSAHGIVVDKRCLASQANILYSIDCKKSTSRLRRIHLRPDYAAINTNSSSNTRSMQKLCIGISKQGNLLKLLYDCPFNGDFPGPMYPPAYRLIQKLQPYVEEEDELDLVKTTDLCLPSTSTGQKSMAVTSALFGISRAFHWEHKNKQIRDVIYPLPSQVSSSSSHVMPVERQTDALITTRLPINTSLILNSDFQYLHSSADTIQKKQSTKEKVSKKKVIHKRKLMESTSAIPSTNMNGIGNNNSPILNHGIGNNNSPILKHGSHEHPLDSNHSSSSYTYATINNSFSPMEFDGDLADDATVGGEYVEYDEFDDFIDDDDATVSTTLSYSTIDTTQTRLAEARYHPLTAFLPVPKRVSNGEIVTYLESEQKASAAIVQTLENVPLLQQKHEQMMRDSILNTRKSFEKRLASKRTRDLKEQEKKRIKEEAKLEEIQMIREQRQMIIEDRLSEQISYVHSSQPRMLYAPVGSAPVPVSTFILEPTSTISVTVADTPPILEDTSDKMIVDV